MTQISVTIAGATKAKPVVVTTATAHGLATNDEIQIIDTVGMVELNGKKYSVTVSDSTNFSLQSGGEDVDGTAYTTWSSAGTVKTSSYSFNEDVYDLHRLDATASRVKEGSSSTDHISPPKMNKIRAMVYIRIKGRLANAFAAADVLPSNIENENALRYAEAKIVVGEYFRTVFRGRLPGERSPSKMMMEEGWEEVQDIINGNVVIHDTSGAVITPTNAPSSSLIPSPVLLPISKKEFASDPDIATPDGMGPDDLNYDL